MIKGYRERLEKAIGRSGLTKSEIARRCGFDRKALSGEFTLSTVNLVKFCVITKTDANWLLGLKRDENERYHE